MLDSRNDHLDYGLDDVRGVSNLKRMIVTHADVSGRDLAKFQVVEPGQFFFNHRTSRNGSKFSITYNYDERAHIVTEDYVVFDVADTERLCPGWLYVYLCRAEFDRYVIQHSWGSSTEFFNWDDLCDVEIDLPPIEVQRRYAAIYEGLDGNRRDNLRRLRDLKLACDAAIEQCKNLSDVWAPLKDFVCEVDERNTDGLVTTAYGVNLSQKFIVSTAATANLKSYKLVKPGQIACCLLHVGRDMAFPLARNETEETLAVSPAYIVFETTGQISEDYLLSWFSRAEVGRLGWFITDSSVRCSMSTAEFLSLRIPVPPPSMQSGLTALRQAYWSRFNIDKKLIVLLLNICPVLIKGSIDEARREG